MALPRISVALSIALVAGTASASLAQQAVVTAIHGLPSPIDVPNSSPVGVNNAGHFAGLTNLYGFDPHSGISYPGVVHSFLSTDTTDAIDIGVLGVDPPPFVFPRAENTATRINNLDQIAANSGDAAFFGQLFATAWLPTDAYGFTAGLQRLPSLTAPNIDRAFGFNDSGVLVGESRDPSNNIRPVRWTLANGAATVEDIAVGFGPNGRAFDVNNLGQIVGQVNEPNGQPFNNFFQTFLYLPSPAYGLPAGINILQAPGVETALNFGFPNDINELGQIFGRTAGFSWHPALWLPEPALGLPAGVTLFPGQVFPDETFIRLGSVGLDNAEFNSVNASGVAVGDAGFLRFITFPRPRTIIESHAFIWRDGQFLLLEDFLPVGSPWQRIFTATGINDSGVITALAEDTSGNFFDVRITLDGPACPSGITRQPQALTTACAGDTIALNVVVNSGGGGDLTYVWRHDGTLLSDGPSAGGGVIQGSASLQLQIVGAGPADSGMYTVEASNSCGTLTSNAAAVTVGAPPQITSQPAPASACVGGSATFTVAIDDPAAAISWQIEDPDFPGSFIPVNEGSNTVGSLTFDASGTFLPSLMLSNLQSSGGDVSVNFEAQTFNDCGSATTDPALLTVTTCSCPADFNHDNTVNSQDFFDFITAFFAQSPTADFNHDNTVNSQDFFDFLSAFFVGC